MSWGPYGCFYDGAPPSNGGGSLVNVGFEVWRNTNQTVAPSGNGYIVDWNAANSDADADPTGCFSLTTDKFTAPQEGRYTFSCGVKLDTSSAGSAYLRLYLNGTPITGTLITEDSDRAEIATTLSPNVSATLWLQSGDTIEAWIYHNTIANATLQGCGNRFGGALIYPK